MKIEIRLNIKDYQEAFKANFKQQKFRYYLRWIVTIMWLLLAFINFINNDIGESIFVLLFIIVYNIIVSLLQQNLIKRYWNNQSLILRQSVKIEFTPKLFKLKAEGCELFMEWKYFSHFLETKNLFILYEGKYLFKIIPKRAFSSDEDLQNFRILLKRNIPLL